MSAAIMSVELAGPGHASRYSIEPTDAGYIWRCDGGALGYGLPTADAAPRESLLHVFDALDALQAERGRS